MFSLLPLWAIWLIICGFCLVAEIFTVSFMMLWPGVAAFLMALLSLIGVPVEVQISLFAILSILLIIFTKPLTKKIFKSGSVTTNVDSIIKKEGIVLQDINNLDGKGKVKIGGEVWSAITDEKEPILKDEHIIVTGIDGVKLKVKKI